MDLSLSPKTRQLLEERLKSGAYRSADDLVYAALEALGAMETQGLDEQALDAIDRAEDQIERGEYRDWQEVREQVRARFLGK